MHEPDKGHPQPEPQATTDAEPADPAVVDLLRRERADFLNFRRRVEQERNQDRDRAKEDVLQRLLPVLDELDRAVGYIPGDLSTHPWVQGVGLSREKLSAAYRDLGVTRVGAEGDPFDPLRHEAVSYTRETDVPEPTVTEVIATGYLHGDRLLRPAQVAVSGPSPSPSSEEGPEEPEEPEAASRNRTPPPEHNG